MLPNFETDQATPAGRLEAVLEAYALNCHAHDATELAVVLYRGQHVAPAQRQLHELIGELLADAAETGALRDDVAVDELTAYCVHALAAACNPGPRCDDSSGSHLLDCGQIDPGRARSPASPPQRLRNIVSARSSYLSAGGRLAAVLVRRHATLDSVRR
jgi:hypothetical protein